MAGTGSPSPPPLLKLWRAGQPSPVKIHSKLARRRSQRRVIPQSQDGLQGRGFFIPGGEPRFMATPLGRGRIVARRKVIR